MIPSKWFREILEIEQCEQSQEALNDQLLHLVLVANKLGFYDAADYLIKATGNKK